MKPSPVQNFGRNLLLQPQVVCRPTSESDVLKLLAEHRGKKIRTIGKLHSWSAAPQADEVLVDLSELKRVDQEDDGGKLAIIGGGCQIKRILRKLDRRKVTLPAVGLITEQTIAGAISTATHGSGRHCISHYIHALRIACYHPETGEPTIRVIYGGEELQAARCSVGCLGIILSVEVKPRPQYNVEEWLAWYDALEPVLAAEEDAPLSQFYFIPWREKFLGQHRREVDTQRSWFATLYHWYWFVMVDVSLHVVLCILARVLRWPAAFKFFFRLIAPLTLPPGIHVVGKSFDILTMEHELFRHIEIELFVRRSQLAAAVEFMRPTIRWFDNGSGELPSAATEQLTDDQRQLWDEGKGSYTHHYPVCIRKILPDETFLSMTSGGDEPFYALSFICYAHPKDRAGFFRFANFLAHTMAQQFDARCHWGKVNPLTAAEIARLYPDLPQFQEICRRFDPQGAFQNAWTSEVLMGAEK